MNSAYDLIVVGGGPAGLTSAKVAAENGLSVALIERKDNAQDILRMCGMMLVTLSSSYMGERVIHNEGKGLLCFPLHGFSLKYDGPTKDFFSPTPKPLTRSLQPVFRHAGWLCVPSNITCPIFGR